MYSIPDLRDKIISNDNVIPHYVLYTTQQYIRPIRYKMYNKISCWIISSICKRETPDGQIPVIETANDVCPTLI